jgi:transcriptional regulator with XRE-family HTH domain
MVTWIYNKRKAVGLSQKQAAEMLGLSRPTYLKLESGLVKTNLQQNDLLARIFGMSKESFERNSNLVLEKTPEVEVREIPKENEQKFEEVLLYILSKIGSRPNIGQTVLYKLLYFIDFDYYEKFEEQLIGATYIKNTYGPTPVSFAKIVRRMERRGRLVEVTSKYFGHEQKKYIPVVEADVVQLSGQELKHIDDTIDRLAHLSAKQLSDLSHIDTPWRVAEDKQILNYSHVFYRPEETSVREYEPL